MTLNLSEAKNHGCRPHVRGSVRRASGFVLTGKQEVIAVIDYSAPSSVHLLIFSSARRSIGLLILIRPGLRLT